MTENAETVRSDDDVVVMDAEVRVCHCDNDLFYICKGGQIRCAACGCVDKSTMHYDVGEVH